MELLLISFASSFSWYDDSMLKQGELYRYIYGNLDRALAEEVLRDLTSGEYKYGFTTDVETEVIPTGLNEEVVRLISQKKGEPDWLLEFRLEAYRWWREQPRPEWGHVKLEEVDYDKISFYAAPKKKSENK